MADVTINVNSGGAPDIIIAKTPDELAAISATQAAIDAAKKVDGLVESTEGKINDILEKAKEDLDDIPNHLVFEGEDSILAPEIVEVGDAINRANTAAEGAEKVNASVSGTNLTITNRNGQSTTINTKGDTGAKGDKGDKGDQGDVSLAQLNAVKEELSQEIATKASTVELFDYTTFKIKQQMPLANTFTVLNQPISHYSMTGVSSNPSAIYYAFCQNIHSENQSNNYFLFSLDPGTNVLNFVAQYEDTNVPDWVLNAIHPWHEDSVKIEALEEKAGDLSSEITELSSDVKNANIRLYDKQDVAYDVPSICKRVSGIDKNGEWLSVDCAITKNVKVYDEVYKVTRECIKLQPSGTGNRWATTKLNNPVNLTQCHISMSFAIDINSVGDLGNPCIILYSSNATDSAHRAIIRIQWNMNGATSRKGWWHFNVNLKSLIEHPEGNRVILGSAFDFTNVDRAGLCIQSGSNDVIYYLHNLEFRENLKNGGCLIVIDNMNPNVPLMADYAKSKGIETSLSIVPSFIGSGGHASLEECKRLQNEGHFIFNHTWSHNIGEMSIDEIKDEYLKAASWMIKNGFELGARVLSNPSANYPTERYIAHMDSSPKMVYHHWFGGGLTDKYIVNYPEYQMIRLLNISALDSQIAGQGGVEQGISAMVENVRKAVEFGGMAVLGFHGTSWDINMKDVNYPNDGDGWKELIDRLSQIDGCTFYTIGDLIEGLYN